MGATQTTTRCARCGAGLDTRTCFCAGCGLDLTVPDAATAPTGGSPIGLLGRLALRVRAGAACVVGRR